MAKKSSSLARLISSIQIKYEDGTTIDIPVNKDGNSIANKVLITEVRKMVQDAIKDYRTNGQTPSPKDLRDIAAAARDVADSSVEIYKDEVDPSNDRRPSGGAPGEDDPVNFEAIKPAEKNDDPADKKNP